jgi:hypothetical protein
MTPYGRVDTLFWTVRDKFRVNGADKDIFESTDGAFAGRVTIIPNYSKPVPFGIVFDFTPYLDLKPQITYQAIRPNYSEIFLIAAYGELKQFVKALERRTASLTDRDEQGRSLLSVG